MNFDQKSKNVLPLLKERDFTTGWLEFSLDSFSTFIRAKFSVTTTTGAQKMIVARARMPVTKRVFRRVAASEGRLCIRLCILFVLRMAFFWIPFLKDFCRDFELFEIAVGLEGEKKTNHQEARPLEALVSLFFLSQD